MFNKGLQGNFKGNDIIKMLKASQNRGPDASGVYFEDIGLNINLDEFQDDNDYKISFGHNLLSVYDLNEGVSKAQPISNVNLSLAFNGEVYNFKIMKNFLNKF